MLQTKVSVRIFVATQICPSISNIPCLHKRIRSIGTASEFWGVTGTMFRLAPCQRPKASKLLYWIIEWIGGRISEHLDKSGDVMANTTWHSTNYDVERFISSDDEAKMRVFLRSALTCLQRVTG